MKTKLIATLLALLTLQAARACGDNAPRDYVAHEWGTFTSVQAADGIQMEWNPLAASDLPSFVHDLAKLRAPNGMPYSIYSGKSAFRMLQRMETPVIYFYTDRELDVAVKVNFPQGRITEWYPQLAAGTGSNFAARPSLLDWGRVRLLPAAANAALAATLPREAAPSHYYPAREVDAAFVQSGDDASQRPQRERFLFYRGVGNFTAPLNVRVFGANDGTMQLANQGTEPLANFFVLQVTPAGAKFTTHGALATNKHHHVELKPGQDLRPLAEVAASLSAQMQAALVKQGLYEREAAAMVATWRDSWFEETGVRVLYVLPRAWTDRVLPLTLNPPPRELVRVMVGRAEVITPAMEWSLLKQVVHYSESDAADRPQVIEATRALGLGRFIEPATRRLMGKIPVAVFNAQAWELMQATGQPAPAAPSVAAK